MPDAARTKEGIHTAKPSALINPIEMVGPAAYLLHEFNVPTANRTPLQQLVTSGPLSCCEQYQETQTIVSLSHLFRMAGVQCYRLLPDKSQQPSG